MPTSSDVVRLLEEYGVIPPVLARASLDRLGGEFPPSLSTLLGDFHDAGYISGFLKQALEQGRADEVQVGDHLLLNQIGRGGMGIVYRARSRVMRRDVAIKLMRTDVPKDDSALKRFLHEVRTAGELVHPHIVSAFHAGRHGDGYYLTMELVHGDTLQRIVGLHGPLGLREALQIGIQVCEGLEYAHRHGFIHRDIKPSNLLLNEQRQVKILDLGLSRRLAPGDEGGEAARGDHLPEGGEPPERLTESGSFIGTTAFMSPEQAEAPQTADHRADMYSVGCTLFLLMTGRPPYKSVGVPLLLAHREATIPSLREFRHDAPPQIDSLLHRLLAKHPDERPRTYAEVIRDLRGCLELLRPPALGPTEVDSNADTAVLSPRDAARERQPSSSGLHWIMVLIVVLLLSIAACNFIPWNLGDPGLMPAVPQSGVTPPVVATEPVDGIGKTPPSDRTDVPPQPARLQARRLGKEDPRRVEFELPPIDRGGTLRITVRRVPLAESNKGALIVSLPISQGRIFVSIDRQAKGVHEHFIGFQNDRPAKFETDFALDGTPKTIAVVIRADGITVAHDKSVIFSWDGDPHGLGPGQGWAGGPKPYFARQEDGQFQVDSVEWREGEYELGE